MAALARTGTGRLEIARDALLVAAAKVVVSVIVLLQGFRALSDDDYARIVIAQRFVAEPSFDPSGTSWLPLPFWVHGGVMALVGRDPGVARATAIGLALLGALLVWIAARRLGASRGGALLGALLACAFPYSAWLGVATVPEAFTSALIVFGAASASLPCGQRMLGALALAAACLSRYEAWPVAFTFAALSLKDAIANRTSREAYAAVIASSAPLIWMAHGALSHGDPVFFLARVAAYRRALGQTETSLLAGLLNYPLAVVRCEPELIALALVGFAGVFRIHQNGFARYRRLLALLSALLAFLIIGDVIDGAPTHHPERAVLAIWFGVAIFAGDALTRAAAALKPDQRKRLSAGGAALVLLCAGILRPWFGGRDAFVDRTGELEIGKSARERLGASDRLAVYTRDFGFFAVIAGFSKPEWASAVDEHDPRKPAFEPSRSALEQRLNAEHASWLIMPRWSLEASQPPGAIAVERDGHVLIRLGLR